MCIGKLVSHATTRSSRCVYKHCEYEQRLENKWPRGFLGSLKLVTAVVRSRTPLARAGNSTYREASGNAARLVRLCEGFESSDFGSWVPGMFSRKAVVPIPGLFRKDVSWWMKREIGSNVDTDG